MMAEPTYTAVTKRFTKPFATQVGVSFWAAIVLVGMAALSPFCWAGPMVASLTEITFDGPGQLVARTSQPTGAQLHVLPGADSTRLVWDFDHTNLGPMVSISKLNQALKAQGLESSAQILTYPGPSVRIILNVPSTVAKSLNGQPLSTSGLAHSLPLTPNTSPYVAASMMATTDTTPHTAAPAPVMLPQARAISPSAETARLTSQLTQAKEQHQRDNERWQQERQQMAAEIDRLNQQLAARAQQAKTPISTVSAAAPSLAESVPSRQLASLKQTIEASKAALSKSVTTINQQNQAIQALKQQIAELKQGVSVSSLDQQSYLDSELSKAQKRISDLQQRIHQMETGSGGIAAAAIADDSNPTYNAENLTPSSTTTADDSGSGWVTLEAPKYEPFSDKRNRLH